MGFINVYIEIKPSWDVQDDPEDSDVESRVNSILSLASVCETLSRERKSVFSTAEEEMDLFLVIKNEVMGTLFRALDDYTVDKRGDVGSWVREAAMKGLERCTYVLCERDSSGIPSIDSSESGPTSPIFDPDLATHLIGNVAKQAVEKIDKIREDASRRLQRLLHSKNPFVPFIPHREALEHLTPKNVDFQWSVSKQLNVINYFFELKYFIFIHPGGCIDFSLFSSAPSVYILQ